MTLRQTTMAILLPLVAAIAARADGPKDNIPGAVRPIPPPGIEVPAEARRELAGGLDALKAALDALEGRRDARTRELIPDVRVFFKAVHDALEYREFFDLPDIARARDLLKIGRRRAEQLLDGKAPWTTETGLVVRGYVSRIDGSVQPYGLVIPEGPAPGRYRLDVWFHGRGEKLSEVNFLAERLHQPGQFTPAGHDRPAPLRPVLQRLQVRRRGRRAGGDRGGPSPVPDRRRPGLRPRLLDGRRGVLAVRRPLRRPLVRRQPRRRVRRDAAVPQGLPGRDASSPPGTRRRCGTSTTAPTSPRTCSSARPSPTAASSTPRSRPPT